MILGREFWCFLSGRLAFPFYSGTGTGSRQPAHVVDPVRNSGKMNGYYASTSIQFLFRVSIPYTPCSVMWNALLPSCFYFLDSVIKEEVKQNGV